MVSGRAFDRLRRRPLRELRHLEGGCRDPARGPPHRGQALRGLSELDARLPPHPLRPSRRCVGGPRRDRGGRRRGQPTHSDRGSRLLRLRGGSDIRLPERVARWRFGPLPLAPERLDQLLARAAGWGRAAPGRPGRGRPERRRMVARRALDRLHREPQRTPRPARRLGGRRRAAGARVPEGRRRVQPLVVSGRPVDRVPARESPATARPPRRRARGREQPATDLFHARRQLRRPARRAGEDPLREHGRVLDPGLSLPAPGGPPPATASPA